jgi:hypothetical protein
VSFRQQISYVHSTILICAKRASAAHCKTIRLVVPSSTKLERAAAG